MEWYKIDIFKLLFYRNEMKRNEVKWNGMEWVYILIQLNSFKIKYNLEIKETPIKVGWNGVQRNGIYF